MLSKICGGRSRLGLTDQFGLLKIREYTFSSLTDREETNLR